MDIKVSYTCHIPDKDKAKILKIAEEAGYGYGDAGPIETIRRFLLGDGFDVISSETGHGVEATYTRHD